jgi:RNA polymerase sigma factor (sigma-70 family)
MKLAKSRGGENTTRLINYLKSSKTQYPILNMKKERELIDQFRNDPDKLSHLLFMHNIRIAFNVCLRYYYKTSDFDDMVGRALYGLAEAADRFDPDKNFKFSTYATPWVYKYVMQEFQTKEIKKNIQILSLNNSVDENTNNTQDSNSDDFEDYLNPENFEHINTVELSTPLSQVQAIETKEIIDEIYNYVQSGEKFTEKEVEVFNKIYIEREKIKNISIETGLSVFRVKQSKDKVLKSIKNMLKEKYDITDLSGFFFKENNEEEK